MPCKWHLLRQLSSVQSFHFLQASVYSIYTLYIFLSSPEDKSSQMVNREWKQPEKKPVLVEFGLMRGMTSEAFHSILFWKRFSWTPWPVTVLLPSWPVPTYYVKIHTVSFSHTVCSFCAVTDEATVWTLALCYAACELLALLFLFIQISALVLFWKADLQISSNLSYFLIRCSFNRGLRKRDKQAQCGTNIIADVERLRIVQ